MISKKKKSEAPSPLQNKICACGCEKEFQTKDNESISKNEFLFTLTISEFRSMIEEIIDDRLQQNIVIESKPEPSKPLYSRLEVAALFGVSRTTIDKWRRYRILPPAIKIASRVYFKKEQITDFLALRERNPERFMNI
jgi:predicted DNA-binding transcriptional regulator AlpA